MKIEKIDLRHIIPDKDQPRKTFEEIGDLVKSITKEGLIEPLKVMELKKKTYLLIDGERRFKALKIIQDMIETEKMDDNSFEKANCIIISPKNKRIIQLVSDVQKHKLPHLEEGEAYKNLMEEDDLSITEISMMVGKKENYIRNKLKLTAFNSVTKQLIREKKIPAQLLYQLDINKSKEAEDEIVRRIMKEKPTPGETRRIMIEEVEKQGALVDHFLLDMNKLIEKIQSFTRRSGKMKTIAVEDEIGMKVKDAIKEVNEFYKHIDKIQEIRDVTLKVKEQLEEVINKYGKGTILDNKLVAKLG